MKKRNILVVEDKIAIAQIQYLDAKVQTMTQVFDNFLNEHLCDEDVSFMSSPVYQKYQAYLTQAKIDLDRAKAKFLDKYIDKEAQKNVVKWTLNYITEELIYETETGE